jgi:Photosynthesis system II assembly factor YCF48
MRLLMDSRRRISASTLLWLALSFALLSAGAATAEAAAAPWASVRSPDDLAWAMYDACAFGSTSLAVAGDGHVAVTRNGGGSWKVVVPGGLKTTAFTAIALVPSGRGVVASGGLLLVTSDGGTTWRAPAFLGPKPGAAISDVTLLGTQGIAVGEAGTILTSGDSGDTWTWSQSPTVDDITSVAVTGDGTAIAGSASGEILVRNADVWVRAGTAATAVTSVAASADPVWGDGPPDLFAAAAGEVLGSDDALTFAALPGLPDLSAQSWLALAWAGVPERSLLVAGVQELGFVGSTQQSWLAAPAGLDGIAGAVAPGRQSVAYLLGPGGRLVRTMSAGEEPATAALSRSRIVVGASTRLTATIRVGAPGTLLLRSRIPGGSWSTQRKVSWASADWGREPSFLLSPSLTREYLLAFKYGGTVTPLTAAEQVVVVPKVGTARSRYDLRVGAVFRFTGSVTPRLRGERVELFTDRGGSWRPVSLQRSVALQDGRTWTSRAFGTPRAETYHLRAHLRRTKLHAEAWSRIVTVTVR